MTKKELLKELEDVDDDVEIVALVNGFDNIYTGRLTKCTDLGCCFELEIVVVE